MDIKKTKQAVTQEPASRPKVKPNPKAPRQALPMLPPEEPLSGPAEAALGFSLAQVQVEALRCLQCKSPTCAEACPLHINIVCTDDGSFWVKQPAAEALQEALEKHRDIDEILAIGSLMMMKACAELTRPRSTRAVVSVKPIAVDGIGLCGGCHVTVGGQRKYACLDGPEFDAHEVDFEGLARRMKRFEREERQSLRL